MENRQIGAYEAEVLLSIYIDEWPLLLTWINFNPNMDK